MNQSPTPGWPPWPGIRPNRIKWDRNYLCSHNLRLSHLPACHRYLEHLHLDLLNLSAAI